MRDGCVYAMHDISTTRKKCSMISFAPNDIGKFIILNGFIAASHLEIKLVIEYNKKLLLSRLKRKCARKGNKKRQQYQINNKSFRMNKC